MSLMRLLTAGKSWVGMSDNAGRYQVTRQRLLPKFGRAANPFEAAAPSAPTATPAEVPAVVPATPTAAPAPVNPEPASPMKATQVIPELALQPVQGTATAAPRIGGWKRFLAMFRWGRGPATASTARAPRRPVQGELTLEGVRVVRNDLSDADLELVPSRPKPKPAAVVPAPSVPVEVSRPAVASAAPTDNPGRWRQAANRLIGIGRG